MAFLVLPPKRFELESDPIYDPIRFKPWYGKVHEMRLDVAAIKLAYHLWSSGECTQAEAASFFNTDTELISKFAAFEEQHRYPLSKQEEKTHQAIIDYAYKRYTEENGEKYFDFYLREQCKFFGVNPVEVSKRWAFDPLYWPTGYPLSIKPIQCLSTSLPESGTISRLPSSL